VVRNGVDVERFARVPPDAAAALRERIGARGRFVFLAVGGIEPRKGSLELVDAFAAIRHLEPRPLLAIVGGHSFQDHAAYRRSVFARIEELRLREGEDLVQLGTLPDDEMPVAYAAADAFAFPSTTEGFGLVVLEALAAGLPVVSSNLPVLLEYLIPDRDALMVRAGDAGALAGAMARLVREPDLRSQLSAAGPAVARRFPWVDVARAHAEIYRAIAAGSSSSPSEAASA
jgi:glycosyltransferase involved in cell wall biosynthesis